VLHSNLTRLVLLVMASYYTRSKAPRPSECSDVEASDVAPVAATSAPSSTLVRPNVAAVGEPESMSTEPAEPVSAPIHLSPAGRPPFQGGLSMKQFVGYPQMGVSALGYPSGLAGPSEVSGQQSTTTVSVGVGTVAPPPTAPQLQAASQQPPTPTPTTRGLT